MKKIYFGYILSIGLIIFIFVDQGNDGNKESQFFNRFNTTNIQGEIEYVKHRYESSIFKIEEIEKEFVFYPFRNELNNYKSFCNIAEKGDMVIKKSYSDTLMLLKKKNNEVYLYIFWKNKY